MRSWGNWGTGCEFPKTCFPEASLPASHGSSRWGGRSWLEEGSWVYAAVSPGQRGHPDPGDRLQGGHQVFCCWPRAGNDCVFSWKQIRSTRLINGLAWASPGHRDSAWQRHREKVLLRSGYAKMAKSGNRKKKMRQKTTGWACQCTRVLSVGWGMAFYNQRFQGDPARDECPCPKKGMEKKHKMQYQRHITVFSCSLFGSFWSENVYFLFPYWDSPLFYYIFLCFCISHSESWYQCRLGATQLSQVSCAAGIKIGVKV